MKIVYTSHFKRAFKKLSKPQQKEFFEKLDIFQKDMFAPHLKTHKLHGIFRNFYAFSLTYSDRIVFQYQEKPKVVYLYDIGSHDVYR